MVETVRAMVERAMIERARQTWYWTMGGVGAIFLTAIFIMWLMGVFDALAGR